MSANATLSNCYIPLPVASSSSQRHSNARTQFRTTGEGKTTNRSASSLRRLCLDRSILSASDGSALLEIGQTKIICSVHGPRPPASSSLSGGRSDFHSGGVLNCEVRFAPGFGIRPETTAADTALGLDSYGSRIGGTATRPEEVELSARLRDALLPALNLESLQKSVVDVFVMVLQSDGGELSGSVVASCLALADAGVEMLDVVCACSVAVMAKFSEEEEAKGVKGPDLLCLADPTEAEIKNASGTVTLALMPNWGEVTFWDQVGRLEASAASEALELCRDGCMTLHRFMRECLVKKP